MTGINHYDANILKHTKLITPAVLEVGNTNKTTAWFRPMFDLKPAPLTTSSPPILTSQPPRRCQRLRTNTPNAAQRTQTKDRQLMFFQQIYLIIRRLNFRPSGTAYVPTLAQTTI